MCNPWISRIRRTAFFLAAGCLLSGQQKFTLTIDNLMRGPELVGHAPRDVRWAGDGERIFFRWKQAADPLLKEMDTYVVSRDGSGLRKLTEEESREAPPMAGHSTKDRKRAVYAMDGDIYLYDFATDRRRQITRTVEAESNPRFSADEKRIAFTRSNNLYVMSLETGLLEQMTDIRAAGSAPAAPVTGGGGGGFGFGRFGGGQAAAPPAREEQRGTESQEYLKKEERELLETVRERAKRREEAEARRKKLNPRKPFQLQARQNAVRLELTPDEKYVIAAVSESGEGSKSSIVPNYVTESSYTESLTTRPKVGDSQQRLRMAILSVETGEVKWVDHGQKETAPPPAPPKPEDAKTEEQKSDGNPPIEAPKEEPRARRGPPAMRERAVMLSVPVWSEDGKNAVLMGSSADNKDRWILALDAATGKTRVLFSDHDDAWLGGPGSGSTAMGWVNDNEVYFQSERDGYSHLYTVPYAGGEAKQLTSGRWEVHEALLSRDKSRFYLTTSEVHPGERQFYSMPAGGGARTRLTRTTGSHDVALSLDESRMADVYSYSNKPPELYAQEARADAPPRKLTTSPSAEFSQYAGSIRRSSRFRRGTEFACPRGYTNRPTGRPAVRRSSSFTAPGTCRTCIATGPATLASTCFITC